MNCEGCFSEKNNDSKMCGGACAVRNCGTQKNVKNCGCCDMYPCDLIEGISPKDSDNRKRLDQIFRAK